MKVIVLAPVLAGILAACGGGDSSTTAVGTTEPTGAQACEPKAVPSAAALGAPEATFDVDVAPVLARACAFSSCHGGKGASNHGVYLGPDAAEVKVSLAKASKALPSMPIVSPNDPANSFLLHKLDDDLCAIPACANDACGKSMPSGNAVLPEATRDAIRRWIAQGAR
jgi:hypothetical protein